MCSPSTKVDSSTSAVSRDLEAVSAALGKTESSPVLESPLFFFNFERVLMAQSEGYEDFLSTDNYSQN